MATVCLRQACKNKPGEALQPNLTDAKSPDLVTEDSTVLWMTVERGSGFAHLGQIVCSLKFAKQVAACPKLCALPAQVQTFLRTGLTPADCSPIVGVLNSSAHYSCTYGGTLLFEAEAKSQRP